MGTGQPPLSCRATGFAADRPDAITLTLEIVCGKGVMFRSIARDLGQALYGLRHVRELPSHTESGPVAGRPRADPGANSRKLPRH